MAPKLKFTCGFCQQKFANRKERKKHTNKCEK